MRLRVYTSNVGKVDGWALHESLGLEIRRAVNVSWGIGGFTAVRNERAAALNSLNPSLITDPASVRRGWSGICARPIVTCYCPHGKPLT